MQGKKAKGVTLVEIVIVLMIIAILALFTLPNIPQIRNKTETKACIGNLWIIKMSKEQWALDESRLTGSTVLWSDIIPDYLAKEPLCPTSKEDTYTLNVAGADPTCTQEGHVLE